jgi:adenylate cyclase
MTEPDIAEIAAWIAKAGLAGKPETAVIGGFCDRALTCGLPLRRAIVFIDTLHPVHEGRRFLWDRASADTTLAEYGRTNEGEAAERWRGSPFYHLWASGDSLMRRRVDFSGEPEFEMLRDLREEGITDFVTIINRFAAGGVIGEMDCVYSAWMTDRVGGFDDADVEALRRLVTFLGLAVKSASLGRIAQTLVETYLGRDAGRRVLGGRIARGVADKIDAVLWFSDLRGYTRISDTAPPEQIIPLLNDYADAIISAIHQHGGDVLKLIGDGVLAIFPARERELACAAALDAATLAMKAVGALIVRRGEQGLPATDMYLGLHIGEMFYGNIGSDERLDFTVVGPAVNEVSRIAAMCRSADQPLLFSAAFAASVRESRHPLVSVGKYALRGVGRPMELFTLDLSA